jgi:hypothetical protein
MTTNDLRKMIDAAAAITRAAQQHEVALKVALAATERDEEWTDWQIGEAFSPVSQALADWRLLMSRMYPTPPEDPAELTELAGIMDSWK